MDEVFETVVDKNTIEIIEEENNMIKKAETLGTLDELNMSRRAKTYFMRRFDSLDEIIWHGRNNAYIYTCHPENVENSKKSTIELVSALDDAGYIRHDINSGSFCISRLYRAVFDDMVDVATMPANLNDFCVTVGKVSESKTAVYDVNYRMGNKKYESFKNPTDEQLDAVRWSLQARLTEREYEVLSYKLGFEDGNSHGLEQTSRRFCITRERVRQIEAKALRKLKYRNTFPRIVSSSDEQKAEIVTIINDIEELRKDPVFKKEAELRQRLRKISKMPFECAEEAAKYLDGGILDFSDIDRLGLSVRAYNCLKRAGINTVADIIKLPKEDWPKVRNLGRHAMEEVEEKVRAVGYTDFSVSPLS